MRVLLDTHALLWALDGSENLSELARHTILTLENEALVSSVSGWEIAIKRALGKLDAPRELGVAIDDAGFVRLSEGTTLFNGLPVLGRPPLALPFLVLQSIFGWFPWQKGESYMLVARRSA